MGKIIAGIVITSSLLPFLCSNRVVAAANYHEYYTNELSEYSVKTVIEGAFDPVSVDEILNKINGIRYEACVEGLRNPSDPSRNLTLADYVPIRWSYDLEQLAMLRASEGSILFEHVRPNARDYNYANYGMYNSTEVLATGSNLLQAIEVLCSEKSAYVNRTGGETGHYVALISPSNIYCGFSWFNRCAAGEFYAAPLGDPGYVDETKIDVSQYSGQYTEINYNYLTNVSMDGDSYCGVNGGIAEFDISFDFKVTFWGTTYSAAGFKLISGGTWTSSNPSVASVAPDGTVTGGSVGTATISFNCGSISLSKSISIVNGQPMYRLYNRNSGEHFYTANYAERTTLIDLGWNDEGIGWIAPFESSTPIYRLYNPYGGEHHYTASMSERDALIAAGWNYEAIGWYSDDAQTVPLYRQYNPNAYANNHNYTTSINENNSLVSIGWRAEGIGWYGIG